MELKDIQAPGAAGLMMRMRIATRVLGLPKVASARWWLVQASRFPVLPNSFDRLGYTHGLQFIQRHKYNKLS